MKQKLKRFGALLVAHIGGVLVGTLGSAPLNGLSLNPSDYLGAVVLAPFEMTIGIPLVFRFYSTFAGVLVLCGLVGSIACFAWGMAKPSSWCTLGMFAGATLWSLANIPVYCAFMSV